MAQTLPCTTVIDADGSHDFAVPKGTTVSGLMAMLHIDPTSRALELTGPDGRRIDLGAAIGADVPSGTVLAVADNRRLADSPRDRISEDGGVGLPGDFIAVLALFPIALIEIGALILPLLGMYGAPSWARIGAILVCAVSCAALVRDQRMRSRTWTLLTISLLFGLTGIALVPSGPTPPAQIAPVVVAWTALIGAFSASAVFQSARCRMIVLAWAAIAVLTTIGAFFGFAPTSIAPIILAVCVVLITAAPALSLRIPEHQLLDLPAVATSPSSLRAPEPSAPSKITMGRITRSLADARARADVLLLACAALALAAAPPAYSHLDASTLQGRSCAVLAVCAPIILISGGRAQREKLGRILPRLLALGLVIAAFVSRPSLDLLGPVTIAVIFTALALAVGVLGVILTSKNDSALIGRGVDILRALALTLLLPAAVLASGFFDLLRQAAS